jgi:nonribosomal peptide synthetase DhbF
MVAQRALNCPGTPAVCADGLTLTYSELEHRARTLAYRLRERGVAPERLVGVLLPRGAALPLALLGVWMAGGGYLPLDPGYPADRIRGILEDAGPQLVITDEQTTHLLPPEMPQLVLDPAVPDGELPAETAPTTVRTPVDPDHTAYVIFTSGSTGRPKGVVVAHRGIDVVIAAMRQVFDLGGDDRVLLHLSPGFDASIFEMLLAFSAGAALYVPSAGRSLGAELADYLRAHRITVATLSPSLLATIPTVQSTALRTLIVGGEALRATLVRRWSAPNRQLYNVYGPTEATIWSTVWQVGADVLEPVPIGDGLAGVRTSVRNESGIAVPDGEPGELCVGGAVLARGYLNRPGLTAVRFVPDPDHPGRRLYRTGDLCRRRPDGRFEFLGRTDRQVKVRGYRIEPDEIETVLAAHPAIAHVAVVSRSGNPGQPERSELAAYLQFHAGQRLSPAELRAHAATVLPDYMLPASWSVLDCLPLGPNGKVDRAALPAPEQTAADRAGLVEPRDDLERLIASVWSEVLGRSRIGAFDSFLSLGGDSLTASLLVNRLRVDHGLNVPLMMLFERPVLADFAAAIFELGKLTSGP